MKDLFFTILFLISISLSGQVNSLGIPFIKNYTTKDYNAYSQNWTAIQDQNGIMYFGNNNGLLQYDGTEWKIIKINRDAIIKTLAIDNSGTIYVGADNEFGFIQTDNKGKLEYVSLSDSLNDKESVFTSITNIHIEKNKVLFCDFKKLFTSSNNVLEITKLPKGGFFIHKLNHSYFMGDYYKGLMIKRNEEFHEIENGQAFIEKDIMTVLPHSNFKILIGTQRNGLYTYDTITKKTEHLTKNHYKKLHQLITDGMLYKGIRNNNRFYFITLYNGTIVTDSALKVIEIYSDKEGIQDQITLGGFQSNSNSYLSNLWLTLNNGITKIENKSPFKHYERNYGIENEVTDIIEFNNQIYLTSSNGVLYLNQNKYDTPKFQYINKTKDELFWNFAISNQNLFASSLYVHRIDKTHNTINTDNQTINIKSSQTNPNILFVGKQKGLSIFKNQGGDLILQSKIPNLQDYIENITEDHLGNLWLTTNNYDLINVTFSEKDTVINRFENDTLLGEYDNLFTFKIGNEVYVSTSRELYKLDSSKYKLKIEQDLPSNVHEALTSLSHFKIDHKGNFWIVKLNGNKNQILQIVNNAGKYEIVSTPFKRIKDKIILSIYPDSKGIVWIGTPDGLFTYNTNVEVDYTTPYKTLIRKITTKNDSILSYGIDPTSERAKEIIELPYELNTVKFHYAAPFFVEEKETKYMTWLEGSEEHWSNPSKVTFKEYTNLREGTYTFHVKAINIYDIESETASFTIRIQAPWYRTFAAYALYFVLFIIIVYIIVKLNVRRLEKDKERLEGIVEERTAEIKKQKEDIEAIAEYLKVANNEIKEQNDQLGKQKREIEEKNRHITDSISYASRIQMALLPPNSIIEKHLPDHFILFKPRDIVSGDYYWFKQIGHYSIYATADCTGHGVPGAFMSMLGIAFLNELVAENEKHTAGEILNNLRNKVKKSLRQTGEEGHSKDGMDMTLCIIDNKNRTVEYAGAYNPLYIYRNDELIEIKATRNPIGIFIKEKPFESNHIELQEGDMLYTFSDGFVDQFGGDDNSKFKTKNFKKLLLEIYKRPLAEQKTILNQTIEDWRGNYEQTDDIIVFGVRIS
jgi:serine phosphatase RsbU (regulator of sigma subunit)/ligand-binding sensor domain-containing protein